MGGKAMTYNRHYCYRIDFADGFVYFGSRTCRFAIASDRYMGTPTTHKAKWLTDTPRVKTVVSVHATRRLANEAEAKLIRDFWTRSGKELSLNASITAVKFNMLGVKRKPFSAEHRLRIKVARKSQVMLKPSPETCAKISSAKKGESHQPHTEETRAKMSKTRKGRKHSASHRKAIANGLTGKPGTKHTAETKAKMRVSHADKRWYTDGFADIRLKLGETVPAGFALGRANRKVRAVVNGDLVKAWTGLESRSLGKLMAALRAWPEWQSYVLDVHAQRGEDGVRQWVETVQAYEACADKYTATLSSLAAGE